MTVSVRLTVFDLSGRLVRTLVAGQSLDAGYHEVRWDGADEQGRSAAAGIYIYRLEAANFTTSRKLILLR
jgi:flagellar hook assembly protein FlgD